MHNNVLHIIRKSTHLRSTFINNQITNHIKYYPYIAFKEYIDKPFDGGYGEFDFKKYKVLNLSSGENKRIYKYYKRISTGDIKKLENFIKENSIDVLHLHYGTDAGLYYKIMNDYGIPSVVSFYGYDVTSFPKMFLGLGKKFLKDKVFAKATKILAMTEEMKNDLLKIDCDEKKIIVHYHGVKGKDYYFPERQYEKKDKIILLIVATLTAAKGHIFLLNAIKELIKNRITNFELRIIGWGELEEKLKKFVNDNNLGENVKFLGAMKAHSKEIIDEYKNADIFVHPSTVPDDGNKEGIPGAIVEAMFSGLPVISTYNGGIPHIIENEKTGLLVNEWDTEKLADSISYLVQNIERRKYIGTNAQEYAMKYLDLPLKQKMLEDIYDSVRNIK